MSKQCRVIIKREVSLTLPDRDLLCLQKVIYDYGHGMLDDGFRFIRRGPDNKLKSQRGQANCLDLKYVKSLLELWGTSPL